MFVKVTNDFMSECQLCKQLHYNFYCKTCAEVVYKAGIHFVN